MKLEGWYWWRYLQNGPSCGCKCKEACEYVTDCKMQNSEKNSLLAYRTISSGESTTHQSCRPQAQVSRCGRTVRNNTLTEVLVFHQTLSTPKASYIGRVPSSTPQERTRIIHIFPPRSNNENEFTILSPFHTTRVLGNTLLQYQVQSEI